MYAQSMFCNLCSISDGNLHIPPTVPQQLNIQIYRLLDVSKQVHGHEGDFVTFSKDRRARF